MSARNPIVLDKRLDDLNPTEKFIVLALSKAITFIAILSMALSLSWIWDMYLNTIYVSPDFSIFIGVAFLVVVCSPSSLSDVMKCKEMPIVETLCYNASLIIDAPIVAASAWVVSLFV